MIKLIQKGKYKLLVTKEGKTMLYLGEQGYLWSFAKNIGYLLSFSKHPHHPQYLLAQGDYRMYEIRNEPRYVDLVHLELSVDAKTRQGYLLLTGLPNSKKIRSRIIPTDEDIGARTRSIA